MTDVKPGQIYRQRNNGRDLCLVLKIHIERTGTWVEFVQCDERGEPSGGNASQWAAATVQRSISTGYWTLVGEA